MQLNTSRHIRVLNLRKESQPKNLRVTFDSPKAMEGKNLFDKAVILPGLTTKFYVNDVDEGALL